MVKQATYAEPTPTWILRDFLKMPMFRQALHRDGELHAPSGSKWSKCWIQEVDGCPHYFLEYDENQGSGRRDWHVYSVPVGLNTDGGLTW